MTIRKYAIQKIVCVLMITMLTVLSFAGCGQDKTTEQNVAGTDSIQIGFAFDSFDIERWQKDRDTFIAKAEELGAEVDVQNANGDVDEQIRQIDYFIEEEVDAIVIVQVTDDSNTLNDAIERAHQAGIPVIAYDRLIANANVDLYISFDNEQVGTLMGEHMLSHIEDDDTIIQINGPLSDSNVSMVMKGFDDVISKTNITVDQIGYAQEWQAEIAYDITSEYLSENDAPDGIMCGNDTLAEGAVNALSEAGLAGEVCVVGQDADLDACQRIVEGTQCMTVYKSVEHLAGRAAELAVELAKSGKLSGISNSMNDGTYNVPYESLEPIAVTADNMDEIITGKYHAEADIYKNVR